MGEKVTEIEVYELPALFVLVGRQRESPDRRWLFEVHRNTSGPEPTAVEDPEPCTPAEVDARLLLLAGGVPVTKTLHAYLLLGMVRFLEGYYMIFVTGREQVGVVGGHAVYRVEETTMLSVSGRGGGGSSSNSSSSSNVTGSSAAGRDTARDTGRSSELDSADGGGTDAHAPPTTRQTSGKPARSLAGILFAAASGVASRMPMSRWGENWAEGRYKSLFTSMDLTRDFYFSYTYDLTRPLQENLSQASPDAAEAAGPAQRTTSPEKAPAAPPEEEMGEGEGVPPSEFREKFVWNHYLLCGVHRLLSRRAAHSPWLAVVIHGFFAQSSISLFGRAMSLTLLARRSRLYAGARLLKRGLCEAGHVANEVEIEQIVADGARGALHLGALSSAVQLRGSVPLVWGHGLEKTVVPRPDIHLQNFDPTYEYTRRHFDELWGRYAGPVIVFDLIRQAERRPRETVLGRGMLEAVHELRARLQREGHPLADGLRYVPFDFKKEQKRKGTDLLQTMTRLASHFAHETGFYCSRPPDRRAAVAEPLPAPVTQAEAEAVRRLQAPSASALPMGGDGHGDADGELKPRVLLGDAGAAGSSGSLEHRRRGGALEAEGGRGGEAVEEEDEEDEEDEVDSLLQVDGSSFASAGPKRASATPRLTPRRSALFREPSGGDGEEGGRASAPAAPQVQRGVVRTNCIDCLDRTNVAQFCIGRCLLQRQLLALGFVSASSALGLEPANALLMRMYEEMGTQLALQYGGSQALNAPNSNAAKDFLQSVKRFYRNTFTDLEKQHIMDVFLGIHSPQPGQPHIWELDSDLYLHNRPHHELHQRLSALRPLPHVPGAAMPGASTYSTPPTSCAALDVQGAEGGAVGFAPGGAVGFAPGGAADGAGSVDGGVGSGDGRGHALFDDFYRPCCLSSFDEILSLPFANALLGGKAVMPRPSSGAEVGEVTHLVSPPPTAGGPDEGVELAPEEFWSAEAMRAADPLRDIAVHTLGAVQLLLPRGFEPLAEWAARQHTYPYVPETAGPHASSPATAERGGCAAAVPSVYATCLSHTLPAGPPTCADDDIYRRYLAAGVH